MKSQTQGTNNEHFQESQKILLTQDYLLSPLAWGWCLDPSRWHWYYHVQASPSKSKHPGHRPCQAPILSFNMFINLSGWFFLCQENLTRISWGRVMLSFKKKNEGGTRALPSDQADYHCKPFLTVSVKLFKKKHFNVSWPQLDCQEWETQSYRGLGLVHKLSEIPTEV